MVGVTAAAYVDKRSSPAGSSQACSFVKRRLLATHPHHALACVAAGDIGKLAFVEKPLVHLRSIEAVVSAAALACAARAAGLPTPSETIIGKKLPAKAWQARWRSGSRREGTGRERNLTPG